jgi:hypothetical protein
MNSRRPSTIYVESPVQSLDRFSTLYGQADRSVPMKQIGHYQVRVRKLLLIPIVVALSWWLAIQAVEHGDDYQQRAAAHAKEASSWQMVARTPIPDTVVDFTLAPGDRRCSGRDRPLSEAERLEERLHRERAGRLAAYHRSLKRKYALAAWLPWLPLADDPPLPE